MAPGSPGPIAIVSLLLGRRREPRHWLIASHGDPAGLAARLRQALAAAHQTARSPTSDQSEAGAGGTAHLQAPGSAKTRAKPKPKPGAAVLAPTNASADHLCHRAFADCAAIRPSSHQGNLGHLVEASYRYQLSLPSGRWASASLACWRRYAPGGPWQRRCGPMRLTAFLEHYGAQPSRG